jgi:hypothetical protein
MDSRAKMAGMTTMKSPRHATIHGLRNSGERMKVVESGREPLVRSPSTALGTARSKQSAGPSTGCYASTMSALVLVMKAMTSARSVAGRLNLSKVALTCLMNASQSAALMRMPWWDNFMSRPV